MWDFCILPVRKSLCEKTCAFILSDFFGFHVPWTKIYEIKISNVRNTEIFINDVRNRVRFIKIQKGKLKIHRSVFEIFCIVDFFSNLFNKRCRWKLWIYDAKILGNGLMDLKPFEWFFWFCPDLLELKIP